MLWIWASKLIPTGLAQEEVFIMLQDAEELQYVWAKNMYQKQLAWIKSCNILFTYLLILWL